MSIIREVITTGVYSIEHQALTAIAVFVLVGVVLGIYNLVINNENI